MAASRMISRATPNHKNPPSAHHHHHYHPSVPEDAVFEFDESDLLWSSNDEASSDPRKPQPRSLKKLQRRPSATETPPMVMAAAASSLPVNIPDWSKILQGDYRGHHLGTEDAKDGGSDGDEEDDGDRVPPHEFLARRRGASLSVHEGFGRTLKGRDLRRVRNAIWKKVGFED